MQPHSPIPNTHGMDDASFLHGVFKGNAPAIEFALVLGRISQVWDDLVDGDKPVDTTTLNRTFWDALVTLPGNAFFAQFRTELQPLVEAGIADWLTANRLERADEHAKTLAFGLRDSYHNVLVRMAYLIGGYEWMLMAAPQIRIQHQTETLAEYLAGLEGSV